MRRSSVRQERCAHTTKNRTEVLCPRVTQAAMIAAASFGLRRSGTFATATSGAPYWAASVRHGPPWPLPVNAPKSIFQNSIRAANSVGSPPSCGEGLGGRELRLQTRPFSHRPKHLGRHDHLGLVPPLIQLEKRSGEFRREQKSSAGFPASAAATTRSKLSCGNLASIGRNPSRARRTWGIREKSPGIP